MEALATKAKFPNTSITNNHMGFGEKFKQGFSTSKWRHGRVPKKEDIKPGKILLASVIIIPKGKKGFRKYIPVEVIREVGCSDTGYVTYYMVKNINTGRLIKRSSRALYYMERPEQYYKYEVNLTFYSNKRNKNHIINELKGYAQKHLNVILDFYDSKYIGKTKMEKRELDQI